LESPEQIGRNLTLKALADGELTKDEFAAMREQAGYRTDTPTGLDEAKTLMAKQAEANDRVRDWLIAAQETKISGISDATGRKAQAAYNVDNMLEGLGGLG